MVGYQSGYRQWWPTSRHLLMKRHTQTTFEWCRKQKMMETSWSSAAASTSKLRATSFFPLQKLKGSQPAITCSMLMAHLEEKSANEEKGINGEDPNGIKGMTEEFIVCLARAVKDTQLMEKHCYHCDSPDHFIWNCPWLAETKADAPLKPEGGMVLSKGGQAPQGKMAMLKVPQFGISKG